MHTPQPVAGSTRWTLGITSLCHAMQGAVYPTRCDKQRYGLYVAASARTTRLTEPRSSLIYQALARLARCCTAALSRLHTCAHLEYYMENSLRPKRFFCRWVPKCAYAYVTACCSICLLDPGHHIVVPCRAGCRMPDPKRQAALQPIWCCFGEDRLVG